MTTPLSALESDVCMPAHSYAWRHCVCTLLVATQWGWVFSMVTTWRTRIMMLTEKRTFAIARRSNWAGLGNEHFIWRGRGARARDEPASRLCVL